MKGIKKMQRIQKLKYTLKHKIAFLKVEKQITGHISYKGIVHDLDKVFMFLFCPWLTTKEIQKIHRQNQKHHIENVSQKTEKDYLEAIIDWECARYTKPDKPLNAYETLMRFYPAYKEVYLPLILQYLPQEVIDYKSK